ncbi:hypothetical protein pipiens_019377 [Culex pipiens pipiens]|uniref:Uncharacterized protein n=1 Tax=Culex pipiens pipiens TaxID=38569 RepID=A0ABD1DVC8_CULPP
MDCTDIVIGTAREETYRVCDYYTRDRFTPRGVHLLEDKSDLTATGGFEVDGTYAKVRLDAARCRVFEIQQLVQNYRKSQRKRAVSLTMSLT